MQRKLKNCVVFLYETSKRGQTIRWHARCYNCGYQSDETPSYKLVMRWATKHSKQCHFSVKRTTPNGEYTSLFGLVRSDG